MVRSTPGDVMSDGTKPLCCRLRSPSIPDGEISSWQIYTRERERERQRRWTQNGCRFVYSSRSGESMKSSIRHGDFGSNTGTSVVHRLLENPWSRPPAEPTRKPSSTVPTEHKTSPAPPVFVTGLLCLSEAATHAWERSRCPGSRRVTVALSLPVICGAG